MNEDFQILGGTMGIFNKNSDSGDRRQIQKQEENDRERERVQELARHVYADDKMNYVLAYDEDNLIYEHKRRHQEYTLDDTTALTYICDDGLMGTREIAVWLQNAKDTKSGRHAGFKIDGEVPFSKKESDTFFHLFHDIRRCLGDRMIFFTPEQAFRELAFDDTDRVLKFDEGKKSRFIRYEDIIGADLNSNIRTISTSKEHIGRALVSGMEGSVNGALGSQESTSSSTIESYDLIIYLEDIVFVFAKKHYEASEGAEVQEIFRILEKIIEENGEKTSTDHPKTAVDAVTEDAADADGEEA